MTLRTFVLATGFVFGVGLATASPTQAQGVYNVDKAHSTVLFRVKHMNTSYAYGRFNDLAGKFSLDDKDAAQSQLDFQVKTASIDTANAARDGHLKGPDFFNAVQYPTITFKSKSVSKSGPEEFHVNGDLTLHGVTRPVELTLTKTGTSKDRQGKAIAGFEAIFSVKRSDFKMANMVGPIGDEVKVTVSVEGGQ